MNNEDIRKSSLKYLSEHGVPINPNLPFLESIDRLRNLDETIDRSLALSAVVACSFGFDKSSARCWLQNESIAKYLTQSEIRFLKSSCQKDVELQLGVEALHAFAWFLGKIEIFSPFILCEGNLVNLFPNLKQLETSQRYRKSVRQRTLQDVLEELDKLYCIHSAMVDNALSNNELTNMPQLYVIKQRRMVLEWLISNKKWEEITLDT